MMVRVQRRPTMPSSTPLGDAATMLFFAVSVAVFMHLAARFVLGAVALRRSLAVATALVAAGALLAALGPPTVLAFLALLVTAVIAVQTAYEVELRDAALVLVAYAVLTAIVGGVLRAVLRLA